MSLFLEELHSQSALLLGLLVVVLTPQQPHGVSKAPNLHFLPDLIGDPSTLVVDLFQLSGQLPELIDLKLQLLVPVTCGPKLMLQLGDRCL